MVTTHHNNTFNRTFDNSCCKERKSKYNEILVYENIISLKLSSKKSTISFKRIYHASNYEKLDLFEKDVFPLFVYSKR